MDLDHERCYRAVASRDRRFDGTFITAVRTTGIYCRPSCPAMTPRRGNVDFYRTAAAAQRAGFRACRRCRPDATPGSPEWNVRDDVVGRVMRMVWDGRVERVGVAGVAAALGYSQRHLNRVVTEELGAGLLSIARTERARTARLLLEATDLPASEVAWAAGFGSVRSFNATMAAVYGEPATAVRARRRAPGRSAPETVPGDATACTALRSGDPGERGGPRSGDTPAPIVVRLAAREPCDTRAQLAFLGARALAGVESWDGRSYRRTLSLPHGHGVVSCTRIAGGVSASFQLTDLRDLVPAIARVRRLLDLDADPGAVADVLGADPLLAEPVRRRPGLRVPGSVDPHETLVRAIAGQQVSVAGARTVVGRLVIAHGAALRLADPELTHTFPSAERLAQADPTTLSMPATRGAALVAVCGALADGELVLDPGADRADVDQALQRFRGIGPWTASYVRMRGLGDPDVMLAGDLGVQHAVSALGGDARARAIAERAYDWRPWRSYAVGHLWASLAPADDADRSGPGHRPAPAPGPTPNPVPSPAGGPR